MNNPYEEYTKKELRDILKKERAAVEALREHREAIPTTNLQDLFSVTSRITELETYIKELEAELAQRE